MANHGSFGDPIIRDLDQKIARHSLDSATQLGAELVAKMFGRGAISGRSPARSAPKRSGALQRLIDARSARIAKLESMKDAAEGPMTDAGRLLQPTATASNSEVKEPRFDNIRSTTGPATPIAAAELQEIVNVMSHALAAAESPCQEFIQQQMPSIAQSARTLLLFDFFRVLCITSAADGQVSREETEAIRGIFQLVEPAFWVSSASDEQMTAGIKATLASERGTMNKYGGKTITTQVLELYDSAHQTTNTATFEDALFRSATLIAKAQGEITAAERAILEQLNPGRRGNTTRNSVVDPSSTVRVLQPTTAESLEGLLQELDGMTGLEAVKSEVRTLANYIRVQKLREGQGLKTTGLSLHLVFVGNPGTGKTTIAPTLGTDFRALGILFSKGHLVETDRAGLIAGYVGQTAMKVSAVVDQARGGVLFIDEAYSLSGSADVGPSNFGDEAIETLLKRMEDLRDNLIVIVAGYPAEMHSFIESNPGLRSRFSRYIRFDDYSPDELLVITRRFCEQQDYRLSRDAEETLHSRFVSEYQGRDKTFGNARLARNIFERAIGNLATRIIDAPTVNREVLVTIQGQDVSAADSSPA